MNIYYAILVIFFLSDSARVVVTLFSTSHATQAVVILPHIATRGARGVTIPAATSKPSQTHVTAPARFQLFLNPKIHAILS